MCPFLSATCNADYSSVNIVFANVCSVLTATPEPHSHALSLQHNEEMKSSISIAVCYINSAIVLGYKLSNYLLLPFQCSIMTWSKPNIISGHGITVAVINQFLYQLLVATTTGLMERGTVLTFVCVRKTNLPIRCVNSLVWPFLAASCNAEAVPFVGSVNICSQLWEQHLNHIHMPFHCSTMMSSIFLC